MVVRPTAEKTTDGKADEKMTGGQTDRRMIDGKLDGSTDGGTADLPAKACYAVASYLQVHESDRKQTIAIAIAKRRKHR